MRVQYPQLFELGMNFEDEIRLRGGDLYHPKLYFDGFITCFGYNKNKCIFFRNKIMLKIK